MYSLLDYPINFLLFLDTQTILVHKIRRLSYIKIF